MWAAEAEATRTHSPLVEPDMQISRIRLSQQLSVGGSQVVDDAPTDTPSPCA